VAVEPNEIGQEGSPLATRRLSGARAATAQGETERPRLILVYSERSGASRRVDGYLAQVLQRRRNHETFVVHRVSIDERPDVAARLGVDEVPAILVVEGRRVRRRLVRPKNCQEISAALSAWLR
jgi:hypothetical protein